MTVANTVIDSKNVTCSLLLVQASGVVIRNSHTRQVGSQTGGATYRIEDSWVDLGTCVDCSIGGGQFTVLRTEVTGGNRGVYCDHCTVQDSWIHGTALDPNRNGVHASAIRVQQYANLIHDTIACDNTTPDDVRDIGCSADMAGYPDFVPIHHNTVNGNLFMANPTGISFCAYGGATSGKAFSNDPTNATYIVFTNNVFQRGSNGSCGAYGPITDFAVGRTGNVWSNNRWDNGGTVAPA